MRAVFASALCALYLYGANDPQAVVGEVAKLRQKYEECRQEQNARSSSASSDKTAGYQKRIAVLESQIKQREEELQQLKKRTSELERSLNQKQGIIQSMERSLTTKDQQYRQASVQNEALAKEANAIKVGKIERESLKNALIKAKAEYEKLQSSMSKSDKEVMALRVSLTNAKAEIEKLRKTPVQAEKSTKNAAQTAVPTNQNSRVLALENELSHANAMIIQLQKKVAQSPVVQEKIVTKTVEPTEKIVALQKELANAQATIASLKKGVKPITQERVVTKVVEPTEKIVALQRELSAAQTTIANLKNNPSAKTVTKEKVVEKIVYKDRPVVQEKVVTKIVEPTEKIVALQRQLATAEATIAAMKKGAAAKPSLPSKAVVKTANPTEELNKALSQKLAQTSKLTPPKPLGKPSAQAPNTADKLSKTSTVSSMAVPPASSVKKSAPSAYRMATNAPVYSAPGGAVVDTWEARRSFTSGTAANGWVKITGYFVNRVWQRADQDLWVKESDVIKR